jgi:hypothetical protein
MSECCFLYDASTWGLNPLPASAASLSLTEDLLPEYDVDDATLFSTALLCMYPVEEPYFTLYQSSSVAKICSLSLYFTLAFTGAKNFAYSRIALSLVITVTVSARRLPATNINMSESITILFIFRSV